MKKYKTKHEEEKKLIKKQKCMCVMVLWINC